MALAYTLFSVGMLFCVVGGGLCLFKSLTTTLWLLAGLITVAVVVVGALSNYEIVQLPTGLQDFLTGEAESDN